MFAQVISNDPFWGGAVVATFLYLPAALLVVNIALLLWLWPDARARGMQKPVGWSVAFLLMGPFALAFYLGARPHGKLRQCPHCGEECIAAKEVCPHCGWSNVDAQVHEDGIGDFTITEPYAHA